MIDKYLLDDLRLRNDEKGELARWVIQLQIDLDTERRTTTSRENRIAELEHANAAQDDHINQQQDRIDTLEKRNGELGKYTGQLEQRLQQPIKLPAGFRIVPIKATREQLSAVQVAGKSVVYTDMVLAAPEHPGFKVEGE